MTEPECAPLVAQVMAGLDSVERANVDHLGDGLAADP